MAGINESKKELGSEYTSSERRNMNRGKPQQAIYRPGSGPLRKSNIGIEEQTEPAENYSRQNPTMFSEETKYRSEGSSPRDVHSRLGSRQKKPEQQLYVPKPVAQMRETASSQDYDRGGYNQNNSNESNYERDRFGNRSENRSKRYSNRRKDNMEHQDEWRDRDKNRQIRQGSEPRGMANGQPWQRQRDTRSVDPCPPPGRNYSEKIQQKPPSGRRHSTIGLEQDKRPKTNININQLAPRFQRKLLLESKQQGNQGGQQPPPLEEVWDGSSVTFQGTSNPNPTNYLKNPSYHPMGNYHHNQMHHQMPNLGYHTLPNRGRGRGRLQQDVTHLPGDSYRSMTPEIGRSPCNSRPPTPPLGKRDNNSRPQTPVNYSTNKNDDYRYNNYNYDDRHQQHQQHHQQQQQRKPTTSSSISDRLKIGGVGRASEERDNNKWDSYDYNRKNQIHDNRRQNNRRDRGDRRELGGRSNYDRNRKPDRRDYNNRDNRDTRQMTKDDCSNSRGDYSNSSSYRNNNKNYEDSHPVKVRENAESSKFSDYNAQHSPVSAESSDEVKSTYIPFVNPMSTLDWSEEVELNDRLEQEALSDALTRSSSMASLVDASTKSMPPNINAPNSGKKSKRKNRRRSKQRSDSHQRDGSGSRSSFRHQRRDSMSSVDNNFKVPDGPPRSSRHRRGSRDRRDSSQEGGYRSRGESQPHQGGENWRAEIRSRQNSETTIGDRSRSNSEREEVKLDVKKAGVIVLPQAKPEPPRLTEQPRYPDTRKNSPQQKSLFDPNNPNKPIIVRSQSSRVSLPGNSENSEQNQNQEAQDSRPDWYDENSSQFKTCHYPEVIMDIKKADLELQYIIGNNLILNSWENVEKLRQFLKDALKYLLYKDLKFCETENVEQHLWKILYYNIIEVARKAISEDPANKEQNKRFILYLIDEGNKYFEELLEDLQESNKFQLNNFLGTNNCEQKKGLGYVGLALNSAQKIFIFLGDLGRYREQVNETANYGKCRQWYLKSHELNPKNGKPYNQLAILAVYSRRKLDAVYYFMRSLMSSNPAPTARQSMVSLFYEIRKKYEGEKKRREERMERARLQMKQKESEETTTAPGSLRKETWIRPDGGKRVHRTTQALQDSEEEDFASLGVIELNKRFVTTYLHVLGKLYTKIGMETFQPSAIQMLKEMRALLQHTPVPMPSNRLLMLLALNMFAIESTQLKDPQLQAQSGYWSENQDRALVVSLQMFNLILERCISLLEDHLSKNNNQINQLSQDIIILLPAIKVWCDWMLCHSSVWNPPPSTQDFKVGSTGDCWTRLATLMNLFEQIKCQNEGLKLYDVPLDDDYEIVKLPEDAVLCGFTPIAYAPNSYAPPSYAPKDMDIEVAQFLLRMEKLHFFGTEFVCGLEPPVLKLEIEDGFREYVSVVQTNNSRSSPPSPQELDRNNDVLLESVSGDEEEILEEDSGANVDAGPEIRDLLNRKLELERKKRNQDLHLQRVKKILSQSVVSVHVEVRPKYLVPDTNCFVDHLATITILAASQSYTLMVPIVVLSELEGLAKGGKSPMPEGTRKTVDPQHLLKVAESAKCALDFLKARHQSVKCVTTKGAILTSTTFTIEDDTSAPADASCIMKNDDKILATCLVLCKGHSAAQNNVEGETPENSGPRELIREVVLLTEDRNLRVKAYARDLPVRELPDFMRWAGLGG